MIKLRARELAAARIYRDAVIDACREAKVADVIDALVETDAYPRLMKIANVEWMIGWLHGLAEAHGVKVEALWRQIAPSSSKRRAA